jgi:hypothetical protein
VTSKINIGIRHVLQILVFFTVIAGIAVVAMLQSKNARIQQASMALLAWMLLTGAASHPDYLAYFNAFAGDNPEEVLVDSDLDWGQDMKRLAARLKQVGAKQVALNPSILGFWEEAHGFPKIVPLDPRQPKPGWNAVSLTMLKLSRLGTREQFPDMVIWTDVTQPTERVGRGILLFYRPEK